VEWRSISWFNFIQYGRHTFSYVLVQVTVKAPIVQVKLLWAVNRNPNSYSYSCLCERSLKLPMFQLRWVLVMGGAAERRSLVVTAGVTADWEPSSSSSNTITSASIYTNSKLIHCFLSIRKGAAATRHVQWGPRTNNKLLSKLGNS